MKKNIEVFIEISKKFDQKQLKKLKYFVLLRIVDNIDKIDDSEITQILSTMREKLSYLDIKDKNSVKDYRKIYKKLISLIKNKYPVFDKSLFSSRGLYNIGLASTLGSSSSPSVGSIGGAVLYASNLTYDSCYNKDSDKDSNKDSK